jgi:hypothetical protein
MPRSSSAGIRLRSIRPAQAVRAGEWEILYRHEPRLRPDGTPEMLAECARKVKFLAFALVFPAWHAPLGTRGVSRVETAPGIGARIGTVSRSALWVKHRRFVAEDARSGNGTQAALVAYDTDHSRTARHRQREPTETCDPGRRG